MALILNIESSTTVCSVCLSNDENVVGFKELNNGYTHAENLHVFIKSVLQENDVKVSDLSAIAVSKGPGSYTGLRIGVSAAKGMAYALDIPLISIDTLQIMTHRALEKTGDKAIYHPMLDARRMEVYTAAYNQHVEMLSDTRAVIIDETYLEELESAPKRYFFGDGMKKSRHLLQQNRNAEFIEDIFPSAVNMPLFSFRKYLKEQFEDVAYFEPFYLKDFYVHSKKK